MAYIGKTPVIGNFQKCDSIAVVNGQAAYTLQVGGTNVSPQSENHMLVSLNGILQAPVDSFTVSGSTLTFASNLVTGDVIDFVMILGNVLDLGVPSDNTVSLAKLTATGTKDATTFLRGDNTFASAGGDNTPSWSAVIDANQTLSDSTDTLVNFDTELYDTDGAYDTTNKRFTVPSGEAGKYFITTFFRASGLTNVTSQFRLQIRKNGSAFRQIYLYSGGTGTALFNYTNDNGNHFFHLSTIMNLSVGDYVDVTALYDTTGDFTIQGSGSGLRSEFSGFKLIGV